MKTSTITVKGQVTVPKALRDELGWKTGDRVGFTRQADGVRVVGVGRRLDGPEVVARLRRARWKPGLTTARLLRLTRGA